MDDKASFPPLLRVRQEIVGDALIDISACVAEACASLSSLIKPGMEIAVTAGSRGIDRIPLVLREVVTWIRALGGKPFLVPAMGSHGGATAEGQKKLLHSLGITGEFVGAEIRSSMETVELGEVEGLTVYLDRQAFAADGIVVVNRIKPHTSFHGDYESGLVKMLAVGLGKERGAEQIHVHGAKALREVVPQMAERILAKANVLFGLALIENGRDVLTRMVALPGTKIMEREPALLAEARAMMPRLPFLELDVLIVDRMGKDISGTGMDTNVIGRLLIRGEPEPKDPHIHRIVVLDLSARSGGSAYGIGLADVTTDRLIKKMDHRATLANALASTFIERAKIPPAFDSDLEAISVALHTSWNYGQNLRLVRIPDTLHLEEMLITKNLLHQSISPLTVLEDHVELCFNDQGNLV